jgi:hypothetical protein
MPLRAKDPFMTHLHSCSDFKPHLDRRRKAAGCTGAVGSPDRRVVPQAASAALRTEGPTTKHVLKSERREGRGSRGKRYQGLPRHPEAKLSMRTVKSSTVAT